MADFRQPTGQPSKLTKEDQRRSSSYDAGIRPSASGDLKRQDTPKFDDIQMVEIDLSDEEGKAGQNDIDNVIFQMSNEKRPNRRISRQEQQEEQKIGLGSGSGGSPNAPARRGH